MWATDIVSLYDTINQIGPEVKLFQLIPIFCEDELSKLQFFIVVKLAYLSQNVQSSFVLFVPFFSPTFSLWNVLHFFFLFIQILFVLPQVPLLCFLCCTCPASLDLHILTHTNPYSFYYIGIQFNNTLWAVS